MRSKWIAPIVFVGMIISGIVAYGYLPEQVPVHWGMSGEPDGYGSRLSGVLGIPALLVLLVAASRSDAGLARLRRVSDSAIFQSTYEFSINLICLFLGVLYAAMLASWIGWDVSFTTVVSLAFGLLFMLLGNVLGRIQPNPLFGIRTPWTLADAEVWRRTHRAGGRLLFVVGGLTILVALLLPPTQVFSVVAIVILGTVAWLMIYSYAIWRQRRRMIA